MQAISAILLGIATNLDNLLLGAVYGARGKRIPVLSNICIALGSALATYACCALASLLRPYGRLFNIFGALILICIGLYPLLPKRKKAGTGDTDCPDQGQPGGTISRKETMLLSSALAVNCLGASFGAGMTGMDAGLLTLLVAGCSFIAVLIGNRAGRMAKKTVNENLLNWVASGTMVVIGVIELLL